MDNVKDRNSLLTELPVTQLKPHPRNPRLDVGDVSELAESVRKNGIMQNLTVIPTDETMKEFTVLIGHRRLAAAKAAGLDKVPCRVIFDMSDAEQVSMMLEENMQRNDLTVYEQAWGFQMMFDFGETVESIADKTGFNESTIYHRLNLAKLDRDTLRGKVDDPDYQINIKDLQLLEKISDIEKRNQILKSSRSSSDIKWKVDSYIADEERKQFHDKFKKLYERLGIRKATSNEDSYRWHHKRIKDFYMNEESYAQAEKWQPESPDEYFYVLYSTYTAIYTIELDRSNEKTPEQKQAEENKKKLDYMLDELEEKKRSFLVSLMDRKIDGDMEREAEIECLKLMLKRDYFRIEPREFDEEFEIGTAEEIAGLPRYLIWLISIAVYRNENILCSWDGAFNADIVDYFKEQYIILSDLGFTLTDEEQQMLDGTHELYKKQ